MDKIENLELDVNSLEYNLNKVDTENKINNIYYDTVYEMKECLRTILGQWKNKLEEEEN